MNARLDDDLYAADTGLIAGVEKLRFFPQVAERGHGTVLVTPDGRRVLDFSASWTASSFGHGHPIIAEAVSAALAEPPGASILSGTHPHAVELASQLLDVVETTSMNRRVYLGHAGTDANDVAVRAIRQASGKDGLIAFEHGYHGGLGTAMAVSGLHVAAGASADQRTTFLPYPNPYRPHTGDPDTVLAASLEAVERRLEEGDVAGVLVEPIQSDGGVVVPPDGFLVGIRAACDRHGALLVVDEVKVGLGRTGHFLAHQREGVIPDLVVLGKALGGGLPLSAVVGPAAALDTPAASALMTTIGNPVSCAAGLAVLNILRGGTVVENARTRGHQLRSALDTYAKSGRPGSIRVGDVRGRGLACGVELVDPDTGDPDASLTAKTAYRGWHLGLIAYPVKDNVIELTPPLTITEDEVTRGAELLAQAVDDASSGIVTDAEIEPYAGW